MRVLYIGGTGNISSACVERSLSLGHQVTVLNRGQRKVVFSGRVETLTGDRTDPTTLARVADGRYDVVADFAAYGPNQIAPAIQALHGAVGQYLFISSASAYQKPPNQHIITEATPLRNPFWEYARNKIACEDLLVRAYRDLSFPATIVRPSYTFGPTWIPAGVGGHGYTIVGRMRRGQPLISHGDGQSLWVMTSAADLAIGFVGLFGRPQAIGEALHITSDEVLTWDQIYLTIGQVAGVEPELVHIPSEFIAAVYPRWGPGLLGDKAYSVVFDNSKIRRLVPEFGARQTPFIDAIRRSMAWHDADPARQAIDEQASGMMDHLITSYRRGLEAARPPLEGPSRWA